MKQGYKGSITEQISGATDFRRVLYTGAFMQLVAMTLQPQEEIGAEVHEGHDQFFHVVTGTAKVVIDDTIHAVTAGDMVIVPSGANHNVINTSEVEVVELYTIYGPPEHADKVVHQTKAVADSDDEHFDGTTTE